MPLRTSNRAMNNLMRARRGALQDYMYGGGPPDQGPPSDNAATPADIADLVSQLGTRRRPGVGPEESPAEEAAESPEEEAQEEQQEGPESDTGITVLQPGDKDDPDMYTYEPMDNGAWMVYPPGVPCDDQELRVELDHPATPEDFEEMQEALDAAGGGGSAETGGGGAGGAGGRLETVGQERAGG